MGSRKGRGMAPPLLSPAQPIAIQVEPLNPPAFSAFGKTITSPLPHGQQSIPAASPPLPPLHPAYQPDYVIANQSTALKYAPISPLVNNYPGRSSPLMSMFVCFPRKTIQDGAFPVSILERHPYTTQTFCPLGLAPDDRNTCFLVIVAPSLSGGATARNTSGQEVRIANPPDLNRVRAFIAHGGQAVTYSAGTWHAPMVVLGRRRVEFVVSQFVSGIPDEDCQEVTVGPGVGVQVGGLMAGMRGAKL